MESKLPVQTRADAIPVNAHQARDVLQWQILRTAAVTMALSFAYPLVCAFGLASTASVAEADPGGVPFWYASIAVASAAATSSLMWILAIFLGSFLLAARLLYKIAVIVIYSGAWVAGVSIGLYLADADDMLLAYIGILGIAVPAYASIFYLEALVLRMYGVQIGTGNHFARRVSLSELFAAVTLIAAALALLQMSWDDLNLPQLDTISTPALGFGIGGTVMGGLYAAIFAGVLGRRPYLLASALCITLAAIAVAISMLMWTQPLGLTPVLRAAGIGVSVGLLTPPLLLAFAMRLLGWNLTRAAGNDRPAIA